LFGLAYGDSLGKPTEFLTYEEIVAVHGPRGPRVLAGQPALVTDDTQMMLAVGEALLTPSLEAFEPARLLSPADPVGVISRGATSSGDSDSIACLAGSFAGAALGLGAWPGEWHTQIEYFGRLARLGDTWD
jgi:ADP-ribosylglycohydrolase